MLSFDTNILLYSMVGKSSYHKKANAFLESLQSSTEVVICELILVELYIALRNPTLFSAPLQAEEAVKVCSTFREYPHWQLVEHANIMNDVWKQASQHNFARRRIFDLRLAKTLQHHGVTHFATANLKDFQHLGFHKVSNPL
jgi:toxin-antitoxin system PIN domain toxin